MHTRETSPQISVVVPSFNARSTLPRLFGSLAAQSLPSDAFEVIVVDDGSTDGGLGTRPDGVRLLAQPNRGPGAARNAGTAEARGDLVFFVDADCYLTPSCLEDHVRLHATHPEIDGICGSVVPGESLRYGSAVMADHLCNWFEVHPGTRAREVEYMPSLNMSIKRRVIDAGVRWSEDRITGEDVEFSWQMRQRNHRIRFSPEPVVHHIDRAGVRSFLRHQYNWGFHAPFVRGQNPRSRYAFLFPKSRLKSYAASPAIVAGYFALVCVGWARHRPVALASTLPLIAAGKVAYARGVLDGTQALREGLGTRIADRRMP